MTAVALSPAQTNRAKYIVWLRYYFPRLYKDVAKPEFQAASASLQGRGLSGISDIFASIGNAASGVINTIASQAGALTNAYVQSEREKQLIKLNAQRAQAGLAPLDANGNVLPQSFYETAAQSFTWQKAVLWGGLGLGGLLLVMNFMGRRR